MRTQPARRGLIVLLTGLVLVATACSDGSDSGADVAITDVAATPIDANTVSVRVTAATDRDTDITVTATSTDGHVIMADGPATTDHDVTLFGLRPETTYDVEVSADEAVGPSTEFTSGSIPAHFPVVEVLASDPRAMAPGLTVLPIATRGGGWEGAPSRNGPIEEDGSNALVALDATGAIVWYAEVDGRPSDFELTDDGTILYVEDQLRIVELSMTGERLRVWEGRSSAALREDAAADGTIAVDTDTMHHEVAVLDDGTFLTLSTEVVDSGLEDLPCDTEQRTDDGFRIIADVVVRFDPDDGRILDEWSFADLLDPAEQPGPVICEPVPFTTWYPDEPNAGDWTHANSIAVDPAGRLLVSLRHLHSVVALDFGDDDEMRGQLLWQLGPGLDFALEGDPAGWQYMQHAPEIDEEGNLILYDNGNLRPGTTLPEDETAGEEAPYSRAVIYSVDDESRTVTQLWEHRATDPDGSPVYSDFVSDADVLDGGNVLVDHGGIVIGGVETDPDTGEDVLVSQNKARIIEVAREGVEGGDHVFDVEIIDGRQGWFVFAAERINGFLG